MNSNWDIIIKPQRKWFNIDFKELWKYRDLVVLFVRRDFVAFYKQTILGPLWFLIQPFLTTIVFTIIFGLIAHVPTTPGIPQALFYLSGVINWNYFADCLNKTSNTFISNTTIFGKVYFPRLIVPVSIVFSSMITYAIQLMLFLGMLGLAFPDATGSEEANVIGAAAWTHHAISPAVGDKEVKAIVGIGEVDYRLLESLRFGCHAAKVADSVYCVKYIITLIFDCRSNL